ncbi:MAG: peptidylprolyl isomerase [Bacillota bacterium]
MRKKQRMNTLQLLPLLFFAIMIVLAGCGSSADKGEAGNGKGSSDYPNDVEENPIVTITMENDQKIKLELYPEIAPNTVANFIALTEGGFYDGLIFHRIMPDFMIQGGDPEGTGAGGPDYSIEGEFSSNDFKNELKHERGVISMARSDDPNSAGSQFFITVADSPHLDGEYAAFGKVTEGLEVTDEIVSAAEEQKMQKVEVDTKGYEYPKPDKVE